MCRCQREPAPETRRRLSLDRACIARSGGNPGRERADSGCPCNTNLAAWSSGPAASKNTIRPRGVRYRSSSTACVTEQRSEEHLARCAIHCYVQSEVRRCSSFLLCLLLLATALVPTIPGFVCEGMGGAHLQRPCCPEEPAQTNDCDAPRLCATCCHATPAPALHSGGLAPAGPRAWLATHASVTATQALLLPLLACSATRAPLACRGAPPPQHPPRSTTVLRI